MEDISRMDFATVDHTLGYTGQQWLFQDGESVASIAFPSDHFAMVATIRINTLQITKRDGSTRMKYEPPNEAQRAEFNN